MDQLSELFRQYTGEYPEKILPLTKAGSNRKYYRLSTNRQSLIGVKGVSVEENKAFIFLACHFNKKGLPFPKVLEWSDDDAYYLQEDLGDVSLFDCIRQGRETGKFSDKEKELLRKTIKALPDIQCKGAMQLDFSFCYPQSSFNRKTVFWDLNYFKYCYLKSSGYEFNEDLLENDFESFAAILLEKDTPTFMYRDFQSRNVIINEGEPFFIDFQGGRKGPVHYDVASFLWQAKANYPQELREELLEVYIDALKQYVPELDTVRFRNKLRYFVLFRLLQVLGVYGFRGLVERKPHFIQSIPYALESLKALLLQDFPEFPYLVDLLKEISGKNQSACRQESAGKLPLTVTIYSFSYKKGIPDDNSGNGGGYVFDCRALNNPGRYPQYQSLTGLDQPVIEFLEKDGEILTFLDEIYSLADKHVERYLARGFTHLMFAFGCTGGQHRSVYSAQHLAEHLKEQFPVNIIVKHREQGIEEAY